jgi:hypothetical protein
MGHLSRSTIARERLPDGEREEFEVKERSLRRYKSSSDASRGQTVRGSVGHAGVKGREAVKLQNLAIKLAACSWLQQQAYAT